MSWTLSTSVPEDAATQEEGTLPTNISVKQFAEMTPGQILKALRERKGETEETVAKAIGWHVRNMSRWENDRVFPKAALNALCEYYGVMPNVLLRAQRLTGEPEYSHSENGFFQLKARLGARATLLDVVCLSLHNVDMIHIVDSVEPDHETTIEKCERSPGGSGANTVSTLGRLGLQVAALGIVANDKHGKFLIAALREAKVNTDRIFIVKNKNTAIGTGFTNIYADAAGRRTIYNFPSVNYHFTNHYEKNALSRAYLDSVANAKILHISSFPDPAALSVQEQLIAALAPDQVLSFNPGAFQSRFGLYRLRAILKRTNVLCLYDNHLRRMLGDVGAGGLETLDTHRLIDAFFEWRSSNNYTEPFILVLKNSPELAVARATKSYIAVACSKGSGYILGKTDHLLVPRRLAICADSTGAGDNCAAGVLYGILKFEDFEDAVDFAFALALRASAQIGGRIKVDPDEVEDLLFLR